MRISVLSFLSLVSLFSSCPSSSVLLRQVDATYTNLIVNGGFESPALANPSYSTTPSIAVSGWTDLTSSTTNCGIEVQNHVNNNLPQEGNQFIELMSRCQGNVAQTVPTTDYATTTYTLSFLYSPRPGVQYNSVNVYFGTTLVDSFDSDGRSIHGTQWSNRRYVGLKATSASTQIRFQGMNPSASASVGAFLDNVIFTADADAPLPASFDWRNYPGIIFDFDQETVCPSDNDGVYLSLAETMSFTSAVFGNGLTPLSSQQLNDCADPYAVTRWSAGWVYETNSGSMKATDYPCAATATTGICKFNSAELAVKASSFFESAGTSWGGDENLLATNIMNYGPAWALFHPNATTIQSYTGGIMTPSYCSGGSYLFSTMGAIVGWNTDTDGTQYWIVRVAPTSGKNIYGKNWGYDGYAYIQFGQNTCYVASNAASFALPTTYQKRQPYTKALQPMSTGLQTYPTGITKL